MDNGGLAGIAGWLGNGGLAGIGGGAPVPPVPEEGMAPMVVDRAICDAPVHDEGDEPDAKRTRRSIERRHTF